MRSARTETGIAAIAITAILVVIALSLLVGCKTQKVTEKEYVFVHDTLVSVRTDTVRDVKVHTIHDTLTQKEVHTYNINNVGDTVKEVHHYHNSEKVIVVDSTDRYKAVVDSLKKALREEQGKNKVVVKKDLFTDRVLGVIVAAIAILVIYLMYKWGKK